MDPFIEVLLSVIDRAFAIFPAWVDRKSEFGESMRALREWSASEVRRSSEFATFEPRANLTTSMSWQIPMPQRCVDHSEQDVLWSRATQKIYGNPLVGF
jgi:hypothetical protein